MSKGKNLSGLKGKIIQKEKETKQEENILLRLFGSITALIQTEPLAMLADTGQLVFVPPKSLLN